MEKELRIKIKVDKQTGELSTVSSEFDKVADSTRKSDVATKGYIDRLKGLATGVVSVYTIKKAFDVATSSLVSLLSTAGKFEKFESVLTTLEGSSKKSQESFDWIKEFATKTPYQLEEVTEAFVKLRSYGINPMSGTLKTLGDTSAAMGKPLMQSIEAIADAVVGENERLKEFGIRANVEGEKIAYGWTDSSGKAKHIVVENNAQIIQSTLEAIFNSKYADAMQNMMGTWGGLTSNMEDSWTNFKNNVAVNSGLFEGAKEGIKEFNAQFSEIEKNKELMNALGNAVVGVAEGMVLSVEAVSYPFKGIAYIAKTVETAITQLGYQSSYTFDFMKLGALEAQKRIQELNPFGSNTTEIDIKIAETQREMNTLVSKFMDTEIEWNDFVNNTEKSTEVFNLIRKSLNTTTQSMQQLQSATKSTDDEIVKTHSEVVGAVSGVYTSASKEAEKAQKEWSRRKLDLVKEISLAEADELAKPYVELTSKYEEDLAHFKGNKEAQMLLQKTFNAELNALNIKTVQEADKIEKERIEKELKQNEDLYKAKQESLTTYYEAINDKESLFAVQEAEKIEKIIKLNVLSNEQMLAIIEKDTKKFREEQFKENNKFLYDFFDNVEKAMDESFFDVAKGKFKSFRQWLKEFFGNIGDSLFRGLSRTIAGDLTNTVKSMLTNGASGNTGGFSLLGGLASNLVGTTLSASELEGLSALAGSVKSDTGAITTAGGTIVDAAGKISTAGNDIFSLVSTLSTLKTAYTTLTGGMASYIDSGLAMLGMGGNVGGTLAGGFINPATLSATSAQTGAFINPATLSAQSSATSAATGASYGTVIGGAALGGAIGYGVGKGLDSVFGAKTYAGETGAAAGAALGGYAAMAGGLSAIPVVGWIAAAALLIAGGAMGKKQLKDAGISTPYTISETPNYGNLATGEAPTKDNTTVGFEWLMNYKDWERKSWFGGSKWTNETNLPIAQRKAIENTFKTYNTILDNLGSTSDMIIKAGKYTGSTLFDSMDKTFIETFTGIPQKVEELTYYSLKQVPTWMGDGLQEAEREILAKGSVGDDFSALLSGIAYEVSTATVDNKAFTDIYDQWKSYAESIDKTVTEALTTSVGTYMQSVREFEQWNLTQKGDSVGALRQAAQYANEDLERITKTLGVTGVTVENFTEQYSNAVKNSFDPNTITQWDALGDALRSSTEAQTAYNQAIVSAANNLISAQMAVNNALGLTNTSLQRQYLVNEANLLLSNAVGITAEEASKYFQSNYNKVATNNIGWDDPTVQKGTYNDYIKKLAEIYTLDHKSSTTTAQSYTPAVYEAANNTVSMFTGLLDGLVESLGDNANTLKSAYNTAQSMLNTINADNIDYQVAQFKKYTAEADKYNALVLANPFDTASSTKFADALSNAKEYLNAYLDPNRFSTEYDFKFAQLSAQNKIETYKATASLNTVMEDILTELKTLRETATSQAQVNAIIARFEERASAFIEGIAMGRYVLRTAS